MELHPPAQHHCDSIAEDCSVNHMDTHTFSLLHIHIVDLPTQSHRNFVLILVIRMRTCPESFQYFVSLCCKLDGHPKLFSFYLLNEEDKVELQSLLKQTDNWILYDIDWCPKQLSLPRSSIIAQFIEDNDTCQSFYHLHGCFFGNSDIRQILKYPPPPKKKRQFFMQWRSQPSSPTTHDNDELEEKTRMYQQHFSELSPRVVSETLQSLKIFFKKNNKT